MTNTELSSTYSFASVEEAVQGYDPEHTLIKDGDWYAVKDYLAPDGRTVFLVYCHGKHDDVLKQIEPFGSVHFRVLQMVPDEEPEIGITETTPEF